MITSARCRLMIAAAFLCTAASALTAHGQNITVNFGTSFRNARLAPLWTAEQEGYFKKNGLDVKQVNVSGGTQGAQMMVSGALDVSYDDPISCIATAGGVPVQAIFGGTPSLAFLIVGGPGVKTIADVKGKRVGSSGLGLSASRLALLVGFRRFGLDADKGDITIVAAGQEPERIAALSAGALAASVVSPEYRNKLEPRRAAHTRHPLGNRFGDHHGEKHSNQARYDGTGSPLTPASQCFHLESRQPIPRRRPHDRLART